MTNLAPQITPAVMQDVYDHLRQVLIEKPSFSGNPQVPLPRLQKVLATLPPVNVTVGCMEAANILDRAVGYSSCDKEKVQATTKDAMRYNYGALNAILETPLDPMRVLPPKLQEKFAKLCQITPNSESYITCSKDDNDLNYGIRLMFEAVPTKVADALGDAIKTMPALAKLPIKLHRDFNGFFFWRNDGLGEKGNVYYALTNDRIESLKKEIDQSKGIDCNTIDRSTDMPKDADNNALAMGELQQLVFGKQKTPSEDAVFNTEKYQEAIRKRRIAIACPPISSSGGPSRSSHSSGHSSSKSGGMSDTAKTVIGIGLAAGAARGIGHMMRK